MVCVCGDSLTYFKRLQKAAEKGNNMTQTERRLYLIKELLREQPRYRAMDIPDDIQEQKNLLRSLFNIRAPKPVNPEFLKVQDEYLQTVTAEKGITAVLLFHFV